MTGIPAVGRILSAVFGTPFVLPSALLDVYPELHEARFRRGGIYLRVGGWCLGMRSVAGITLGRTIWLAPYASLDPELLLHELRHVHQFATIRWFPVLYVWESLRRGYSRNRYEVDAASYAARRLARSPGAPHLNLPDCTARRPSSAPRREPRSAAWD